MGKLNVTSDNRRLRLVESPLAKDDLLLVGLSGREEISRLFTFQLELVSEKNDLGLKIDDIVGSTMTVSVKDRQGERFFNGIVSRFAQGSTREDFTSYHAQVVPRMWLLTRRTNCRIFQNKSVPAILREILEERGIKPFDLSGLGSFAPREYCVQYRESDFNFISRLCEEEGIFYFFKHEQGKHSLVFGDKNASFPTVPGTSTLSFQPTEHAGTPEDVILGMDLGQEIRSGRSTLRDYNFKKPLLDLTSQNAGKDKRRLEVYDYPGEYEVRDEGDRYSRLRQEEEDTPRVVLRGGTFCRRLGAGFAFNAKDHPVFSGTFVLTSVSHSASEEFSFAAGSVESGELSYHNTFECIPASTIYRPARITPEPKVLGPQTAIVVGRTGEEIEVDEFGRVKVQFHWDRIGQFDEKSSCFIRVRQDIAGRQWGAMFLPRVGQEVVVEFLEGDPDRPLITGCVYNADQMPAYKLPDEKTKSYIKTNSTKGGGGFNEIRFEDKKGAEQLFLHAQRNLDVRSGASHMHSVGGSYHLTVGSESGGGDYRQKVFENKFVQVLGEERTEIRNDRSDSVEGHAIESVGGKRVSFVGDEEFVTAPTIILKADREICFMVGGNFIKIDPSGVTIFGTLVNINSGGAPSVSMSESLNPSSPLDPAPADGAKSGLPSLTKRSQTPPEA